MNKRMVIVSNRLPIVVNQGDDGTWNIKAGEGGLVTALEPLMRKNHGVWIGWPGCGDDAPMADLLEQFTSDQGYSLQPVPLSDDEVENYYRGFANETLWPLFHDLLGNCHFSLEQYRTYELVNRRFAKMTAEISKKDDVIWIHDYQLILCGWYLRQLLPTRSLAFFLHIPFPTPDLFRRLPWKSQILQGMLSYDLVGFQTLRDHRNFVHCVTSLIGGIEVHSRQRHSTVLKWNNRLIRAGHFPISIDADDFIQRASAKEVDEAAWYLHENYEHRQLMLGIDRLDYTKGIPERFLAFERALEKYPEMRQKVSLLQVVVPSRTMVPDYIDLKTQLDQLAGRINGRFAEHGWVPLHYHYRSLDPVQLLAHYRTAEIALITPLRDGMNLVAKEYCACSIDNNGVLVLSEFAGAADQLGKHALLVNPYDVEKTADTLFQAFSMPSEERRRRMTLMRNQIKRHDVHRWLDTFIKAL
ncbi:MAG: trehalose-6-phosphate synthase [Deltaproteobacteria bacterium]|jgi:trehalose 6-phosphate synthase|nr:trehalose-6-phosphate synthase [Deltaproteobacteria bacterium]